MREPRGLHRSIIVTVILAAFGLSQPYVYAEQPTLPVPAPVAPQAPQGPALGGFLGDLLPPGEFVQSDPVLSLLWTVGSISTTFFGFKAMGSIWGVFSEGIPAALRARKMGKVRDEIAKIMKQLQEIKPELTREGEILRARVRDTNKHLAKPPANSAYAQLLTGITRQELDMLLDSQAVVNNLRNRDRRWLNDFRLLRNSHPDELESHIQKLGEGTPNSTDLKRMRPEILGYLIDHPDFEILARTDPKTSSWILDYEHLRRQEKDSGDKVLGYIRSAIAGTRSAVAHANKLAKGWLLERDIRTRSYDANAEHEPSQPGVIRIRHDGSSGASYTDNQTPMGEYIEANIVKCGDAFAKVDGHADRQYDIARKHWVAPIALSAVTSAGFMLQRYARSSFKQTFNKTPEQVRHEEKLEQQKTELRENMRVQELDVVAQALRDARTGANGKPKDDRLVALYSIIRNEFRKSLTTKNPATKKSLEDFVQARLRKNDVKQEEHFHDRLAQFANDDEMANFVIDLAVAKAAGIESRSVSPDSVAESIWKDVPDEAGKMRFLMKAFGFSVEYLWPQLQLDSTGYPVDNSYFTQMTDTAINEIHKAIEERKKLEKAAADKAKENLKKEKATQSDGTTEGTKPPEKVGNIGYDQRGLLETARGMQETIGMMATTTSGPAHPVGIADTTPTPKK